MEPRIYGGSLVGPTTSEWYVCNVIYQSMQSIYRFFDLSCLFRVGCMWVRSPLTDSVKSNGEPWTDQCWSITNRLVGWLLTSGIIGLDKAMIVRSGSRENVTEQGRFTANEKYWSDIDYRSILSILSKRCLWRPGKVHDKQIDQSITINSIDFLRRAVSLGWGTREY